jgi:hypothetical protein
MKLQLYLFNNLKLIGKSRRHKTYHPPTPAGTPQTKDDKDPAGCPAKQHLYNQASLPWTSLCEYVPHAATKRKQTVTLGLSKD